MAPNEGRALGVVEGDGESCVAGEEVVYARVRCSIRPQLPLHGQQEG